MRPIFLISVFCMAAALSGCASVDKALFGGNGISESAAEPSTAPAPENPDADLDQGNAGPAVASALPSAVMGAAAPPGSPQAEGAGSIPGTLPPVAGAPPSGAPPPSAILPPTAELAPPSAAGSVAVTVAPVSPPPAHSPMTAASGAPAISPVVIAPGPDTGTAVGRTAVALRGNLQEIAARLNGNAGQYASLRTSSAQQLATYYQAQAQISAKLQIGTTRGNPELVAQWNAGQAALDQLTANINALGSLATQINGETARTRTVVSQIDSALAMPAASDEDHRQLSVLEDEANQILVVLDRLARDVSADLRRQTATLSSERPHLAQLANAIKAGELYPGAGAHSGATPSLPAVSDGSGVGQPVVTIRFARRNTDYQKTLYNALNQALQAQPTASFRVIGVSPTRGSASAVQSAQNEARRHAQDVMRTMAEMGVPPSRMEIAAATDPSVKTSEVRLFVQ